MPLNPNISLAYKGIELQNPLDQYGKVMALQSAQQQNALAQRQMQEYDRSLQESEGIRNRLAGGAKIDDPETYNFLLGSKTGREILKQEVDLQKARTEESARRTKLMVDAETMWRNIVDQVRTKEDAVLFLDKMRNDPAMKGSPLTTLPFEGIVAQLPSDSAGLNEWAKRFAIGATKWVTENKPTLSTKDTGGELIDRTYEPLTGKITEVSRTAKVMSPEARAANARAQAAQNLAERKFAYEKANPGYTVQAQSDGTLVAINNRNPSDVKPVSMGGAPVQKGATNITEGERKAATLLTRLRGSSEQLNKAVEGSPGSTKPGVLAESARAVLGDTPANLLTGQARQRVEAAQLDMLDAALTLGTGAAYTKEQLRGYAKSYFPQIGDDPETIEDKKQRLSTLIQSAEISAGRAGAQVPKSPGAKSGGLSAAEQKELEQLRSRFGKGGKQ